MKTTRHTLEFAIEKFMSDIREASKADSLRGILKALNSPNSISASTLSRIDNGNLPDMKTFIVLCEGLNLNPQDYWIWYEWTLKPVVPKYKTESEE